MKKTVLILMVVFASGLAKGQRNLNDQMQVLEQFVGNWIGTSKGFKNSKIIRNEPAFEKIEWGLDGNTLEIDLYSESLRLHTIIFYDSEEEVYSYNPFYKTGAASYPARFENGKLIITPNVDKRFIFEILPDGRFREYGEQRIEGKWELYFEDTFTRVD